MKLLTDSKQSASVIFMQFGGFSMLCGRMISAPTKGNAPLKRVGCFKIDSRDDTELYPMAYRLPTRFVTNCPPGHPGLTAEDGQQEACLRMHPATFWLGCA